VSTPEELRERAVVALDAAEEGALRALEGGEDAAERFERQADEVELAEWADERRAELARDAAAEAKVAIDGRAVSAGKTLEADRRHECLEQLEAELARCEDELAKRRDQVERATANADMDRALELERSLDHFDPDVIRVQIATTRAAEADARDAAAEFSASAEQAAARAADYRRESEGVDDELRAEHERRRTARALVRAGRLTNFKLRALAAAVALQAAASEEPSRTGVVDSASEIDQALVVLVDRNRKLQGLDLPLRPS
jgi:hypothetical protein